MPSSDKVDDLAGMDSDLFRAKYAARFGAPHGMAEDDEGYTLTDAAREGKGQQVTLVAIMLRGGGVADRIAFADLEHGDGAGLEMCVNIMAEMLEDEELEPGESYYLALLVASSLEAVTL